MGVNYDPADPGFGKTRKVDYEPAPIRQYMTWEEEPDQVPANGHEEEYADVHFGARLPIDPADLERPYPIRVPLPDKAFPKECYAEDRGLLLRWDGYGVVERGEKVDTNWEPHPPSHDTLPIGAPKPGEQGSLEPPLVVDAGAGDAGGDGAAAGTGEPTGTRAVPQ